MASWLRRIVRFVRNLSCDCKARVLCERSLCYVSGCVHSRSRRSYACRCRPDRSRFCRCCLFLSLEKAFSMDDELLESLCRVHAIRLAIPEKLLKPILKLHSGPVEVGRECGRCLHRSFHRGLLPRSGRRSFRPCSHGLVSRPSLGSQSSLREALVRVMIEQENRGIYIDRSVQVGQLIDLRRRISIA